MPRITLTVAGRDYDLAVRDGDAPRFEALAAMVDAKAAEAARGVGGMTENRQLLFAALLLADELAEARAVPAGPSIDTLAIERLAERAEALAERLERSAQAS